MCILVAKTKSERSLLDEEVVRNEETMNITIFTLTRRTM
jgi:hypothetical protein